MNKNTISIIKSHSIREFLPLMCESTLKFMCNQIIREEFYNKIAISKSKNFDPNLEMNHSEENLHLSNSGKYFHPSVTLPEA